ncbi:diguanylate cyclase (GGDEF) domain protein [Hoeflea phototrophica DFL-43]|uniref:Diguanylate cyclase (GGDEF) domain protein n=1 Tax=Hoeflea phototrophica (strain DSM 17068 / NCIMB 14078 / DFL-43) TaxID=411684 RepID=A9DG43_HOEPD|nr:diguanylate cyclase [Hoeflea phototrophica]EDQ31716.2 diguanylate cyclase (GGDEF) domain protein [Hoeflea phototrophica DFL-43]
MMAGNTPKHIFGYLFLLGIVAVGMILGSVFWLTGRIDQLEKESSESIVELLVTEKVAHVKASTSDYSYWDLAYELVKAEDAAGLYDNIGAGATESDLFDHIIVLSADGQVLHVYDGTGAMTSAEQFDVESVQPFLSRLRETRPKDYVTVSGIGQIKGIYGAIAASWITPDYLARVDAASLPIMLGVKLFGDEALHTIAKMTQGTGYAITPADNPPNEPSVDLVGPDGTPVAQLVWTHKHVGTMLRMEIMPGILLVCFGIFAICVFAARYFHQQSKALARAMTVASTDKLTGLLNRSGLDEVLRKPDAKARIDAGEVAVLYLDLNDFKKLNDEHGHREGDHALKATAERLKASVRPHDYVVRLGGDEFICVVFDQNPAAAAKSVSDRVLISCNAPIAFVGFECILAPALGVAVAEPGIAWETLLGRADAAMYSAKRKQLRIAEFYVPENAGGLEDAAVSKPAKSKGTAAA